MSSMYITEPATSGKVLLKTTVGDLDVELWTRECPLACRNFIQHCLNGYYDGVVFHRLVKNFIVQTGDPTGTGHGGESIYGDFFKNEHHQRLQFNRRGLLGMAGEKRDQNGSQFFFTLDRTPELNKQHTLFGKITGKTVFNLLKLNECDVDQNERPTHIHKILQTEVLLNPFKDLKSHKKAESEKSENKKREKRHRNKDDHTASKPTKNIGLLSFGDEFEEDEDDEEITSNKKFKSKSAHDVLDDEKLSKEHAVHANELGETEKKQNDDEEKGDSSSSSAALRLQRVKERVRDAARSGEDSRCQSAPVNNNDVSKSKNTVVDDEDVDIDELVDEHKRKNDSDKLKKLSDELKSLQKEYIKSIRGPKQPKDVEASISNAIKSHNKMRLNFKSASKNVVKQADKKREIQSMNLLERFTEKMNRASVKGVLSDRRIDVSDLPSQAQIIAEATLEEQGRIELDVEDLDTKDEWMEHKLVAPEGIRRDAKDANLKDQSEDWYSFDDSRNKMNIRRREGAINNNN